MSDAKLVQIVVLTTKILLEALTAIQIDTFNWDYVIGEDRMFMHPERKAFLAQRCSIKNQISDLQEGVGAIVLSPPAFKFAAYTLNFIESRVNTLEDSFAEFMAGFYSNPPDKQDAAILAKFQSVKQALVDFHHLWIALTCLLPKETKKKLKVDSEDDDAKKKLKETKEESSV
jgi:hypothetical protein